MMLVADTGWLTAALWPLAVLFVFSAVVFFHELGHFLVARWCGVKVQTFSIGFGKEIVGWNDRKGTRWRIAWIPLGGYVKFMDDENPASAPSREIIEKMTPEQRETSFHAKPLWQRAAVVAAGPIANFLLSIVIFAIWYGSFGIPRTQPRVDEVVAGSPAEKAGLKAGDVVLTIDGQKIESFEGIKKVVLTRLNRELDITVQRGPGEVPLKVTPHLVETFEKNGQRVTDVVIGVKNNATPDTVTIHRPGPLEAARLGVENTAFLIKLQLSWIGDLVRGQQKLDQLGGIGRIADITGKVVEDSPINVVYFLAFVSVGIGLLNLFPIPLLDGGHLFFYALEAIRRRPLSERAMEMSFRFGFAVVLMLMMLAFYNDRHIYADWARGIADIFGRIVS
jgi:regulator of sigma E protease